MLTHAAVRWLPFGSPAYRTNAAAALCAALCNAMLLLVRLNRPNALLTLHAAYSRTLSLHDPAKAPWASRRPLTSLALLTLGKSYTGG
jgi:hypothetical protein